MTVGQTRGFAGTLVVDTSAPVAVLTGEADAEWLTIALEQATNRLMPTPTYVELGIVLESRFGPGGTGSAGRFVRDSEITLIDLDRAMAERALEGWRRYGRGRHPAALNLGDCYVYGLASELAAPVLCTRQDFAQTDVAVLRPPGG
ncbi:MAG TPA: type II toxin-antitoxin system VapC family toxin [Jiangellaceae bacterium]|nr:type II toxin-antitoxin system VapC family toxin [Jiangellaceae bacterium]